MARGGQCAVFYRLGQYALCRNNLRCFSFLRHRSLLDCGEQRLPDIVFCCGFRVGWRDLFAAVPSSGVFRSTDDGNNWTLASNGFWNMFCLAAKDSVLLVGDPWGVIRTTDRGKTWSGSNGLPSNGVYALAVVGADVFAGMYEGVFISTDDGLDWVSAGTHPHKMLRRSPAADRISLQGLHMRGSIFPQTGVQRGR